MNDFELQRLRSDKIFCDFICPIMRGVRVRHASDLPSFSIKRLATKQEDMACKFDFVNDDGLRLAVRVQDNPQHAHYETMTLRETERCYLQTWQSMLDGPDWYVHAYVQIPENKTHLFCMSSEKMALVLGSKQYRQRINGQDNKRFVVIDGRYADFRVSWQQDLDRKVATCVEVRRTNLLTVTK